MIWLGVAAGIAGLYCFIIVGAVWCRKRMTRRKARARRAHGMAAVPEELIVPVVYAESGGDASDEMSDRRARKGRFRGWPKIKL